MRNLLALWVGLTLSLSALATPQKLNRPPVIFAHGLFVPHHIYEDFSFISTIFAAHGYPFYVARTPMHQSLAERAAILASEIKRLVPTGPYHLIGHSMGGLDARLAIHQYGLGDRCLSLTSIATPHHGSLVAEWIKKLVKNEASGDDSAIPILDFFRKFYGDSLNSLSNLTPDYLEKVFNPMVKDDPRVTYFSLSFYTPWPFYLYSGQLMLAPTHQMLLNAGEANDGLVSVNSSLWGESLGLLLGDHIAETFPGTFAGSFIYPRTFLAVIKGLERF